MGTWKPVLSYLQLHLRSQDLLQETGGQSWSGDVGIGRLPLETPTGLGVLVIVGMDAQRAGMLNHQRPTPRSIAEFCCCCCCFSSFLPCSKNTLGIAVSASLCICVHTRVVLGAELSVHTPKFQMIFSTCASTHSVLEPGLGRSGVLSHGRVPEEAGGSRLNL